MQDRYAAVIVGGGAAGLSAALLLGRSRRHVLLCDGGLARNACADEMHGFLSRDGTQPGSLEKIARARLEPYATIHRQETTVSDIKKLPKGFSVALENGTTCFSDLVLLATGMADALLRIDRLARSWGRSTFVCPDCDGWEVRDRAIAVSGDSARSGIDLA
jgi:thioredoxin reductase